MTSLAPLVLAVGDSLVAGYGLAADESFPAQLEQRLLYAWPEVRVAPAGVSGDTSGDVLRRLPGVLGMLDRAPDLAIVQVGPNDVLRQVPAARTRDQLDAIVAGLTSVGATVLLTVVAPPPVLRARASGYLGIHEDVAAAHGAALCPFFPPGVLGHAAMVLDDRVHPNAGAITAVVDAMLPTVDRLLRDRAAS